MGRPTTLLGPVNISTARGPISSTVPEPLMRGTRASYAAAHLSFGCSTEQSGPLAKSSSHARGLRLPPRQPSPCMAAASLGPLHARPPAHKGCSQDPFFPLPLSRACTEPNPPPVDTLQSSSWKYDVAPCLPIHSPLPGAVGRVEGLHRACVKPSVAFAGIIVHRAPLNCSL
jgi:hypothetical protein